MFEYNHGQELKDYHKKINGELLSSYVHVDDADEFFAEEIEVFSRDQIPVSISGMTLNVTDDSDELKAIVTTGVYTLISSGGQIVPEMPAGSEQNFVGSILKIDEKEFIIDTVAVGVNGYPEFKVFKKEVSGLLTGFDGSTAPADLEKPEEGKIFLVIENMLSVSNWHQVPPNDFKIGIDPQIAAIYTEDVDIFQPDGFTYDTHEQKFRGIFKLAAISKFLEDVPVYDGENVDPVIVHRHAGLYKIEFQGFSLGEHYQFHNYLRSVEWYNGVVRMRISTASTGEFKSYKVLRTENIDTAQNLILYIMDPEFVSDPPPSDFVSAIFEGSINVNYYPGYRVYLYQDATAGLTEEAILPAEGEGGHYSMLSLRSANENYEAGVVSRLSIPAILFAQEIVEPKRPEDPLGGKYTTRPDFFGKSTYTIVSTFLQKPHAVQFNRGSEIQILSSLYSAFTLAHINADIFNFGEDEHYYDRWDDLLTFDRPSLDVDYHPYPLNGADVPMPMPDNPNFIAGINNFIIDHNKAFNLTGTNVVLPLTVPLEHLDDPIIPAIPGQSGALVALDFIKDVIHNCFVPLTEIPAIFDYIKFEHDGHKPMPGKQVTRDANGNLLKPTRQDGLFAMAPMMVINDPDPAHPDHPIIQFTDFNIDGASNARYFYTVREFNIQMVAGEYSKIVGPVNLVNTQPPKAPEIIKTLVVLENRVLNIEPAIQFQINAYDAIQHIGKIILYRAKSMEDALTVRTMNRIKEIDIEVAGLGAELKWIYMDDFSDLDYIPYSDPLYYKITVERKIRYADRENNVIEDFAPSEPSKLIITNIVENYSPDSPVLSYISEAPVLPEGELKFVTFIWDHTVYKGIYHLYKMSSQGNWTEICRIRSDRNDRLKYHIENLNAQGVWAPTGDADFIDGKVYLPVELTNLNDNTLIIRNSDGSPVYHHFKVIAENTAGMFSSKENILTVYDVSTWNPIGGIGSMIIGTTFIVR